MPRRLLLPALALLLGACALWPGYRSHRLEPNLTAMAREFAQLRERLQVPGLAWAVIEDGRVVGRGAVGTTRGADPAPFGTDTPLRIASVTKTFTAVLALQLAAEGRLELDAPVSQYLPDRVPEDVRVRHLLTHTSEGEPGTEYVYGTARYGLLAPIIAEAGGVDFKTALRSRVLEPAGMRWHESPQLGAHAGLVSTIDDLAKFVQALDRGLLLDASSLALLATPSQGVDGRVLPVSLGWFAQDIQGRIVTWSFGQDDPEHSGALLVRDPVGKRSLVLLANANEISDAFRLLMGDARRSPFAMSFYRNLLASPDGAPRPRPHWDPAGLAAELAPLEADGNYRYVDEVIAETLVRLWIEDVDGAAALLTAADARYGIAAADDPVLHFAALRLPAGAFKDALLAMGFRLVPRHLGNRWILLAQGHLLQQLDRYDESTPFFEAILALPRQNDDFMRLLFHAWSHQAIADAVKQRDPARARAHLKAILDSEVGGEAHERARRALDALDIGPPLKVM